MLSTKQQIDELKESSVTHTTTDYVAYFALGFSLLSVAVNAVPTVSFYRRHNGATFDRCMPHPTKRIQAKLDPAVTILDRTMHFVIITHLNINHGRQEAPYLKGGIICWRVFRVCSVFRNILRLFIYVAVLGVVRER